MALMHVDLFSDGSSRGNPGPGGYGTVLHYVDTAGKLHVLELSQGFERTTNNRMELMGVIAGFEVLKRPCEVRVVSDSQYVINAFQKNWVKSWIDKGWRTSSKEPVKNVDLWKRLLAAMEPHEVSFSWVRGHRGHPENERCDELATSAADGLDRIVDEGFEE
jgi:ribonuclease HI